MTDHGTFIKTMDEVLPHRIDVDYWINLSRDAENIRMTSDRIQHFNKENMNRPTRESNLYNLAGFSRTCVYAYGFCVRRSIIWSTPCKKEAYSAIYVNEPVVILGSRRGWYKICCVYYEGWVESSYIALCRSYKEWLKCCDMQDFVVVTGDFVMLSDTSEAAGLRLDMGVRLELVATDSMDVCEKFYKGKFYKGNFYNYMVKVPIRGVDGFLRYIVTGLPVSKDIHKGYLTFTGANVVRQAFKTLGNVYGWGGILNSRDCSALVMDVHRCFGLIMPRDVSGQMAMIGCETLHFKEEAKERVDAETKDKSEPEIRDKTDWEKLKMGDILGFPGHTMIYLGYDKQHYVISATGGFFVLKSKQSRLEEVRADSCIISTLNVTRKNGLTWKESVSYAKLLR